MGNSTHGHKRLTLPAGLETGLRGMGMRPVRELIPGTHRWTHPKNRTVTITLVTSNMPGSDAVMVTFDNIPGAKATRLGSDALLALLDFYGVHA